jgi:hypothetical protein
MKFFAIVVPGVPVMIIPLMERAAVVLVLERSRMVFEVIVFPVVDPASDIPSIAAVVVAPVLPFPEVKLAIVLFVMLLVPAELTIPRTPLLVEVDDVLRLAFRIVLGKDAVPIVTVPDAEFRMP